jgi:hypothetical protein
MKKSLRVIATTFLTTSLIFIGACKKGDTGSPGKDGNANVASHTFSTNSWLNNSSRYYQDYTIPELTSDNINTASVEVYFSTTANNWVALPYTYVSSPNNYFMGFISTINKVEVTWDCNSTFSSGSDPNNVFGTTVQIKIVVIPPAQRKAHPNVNHHNYTEVKAAYNLKD